MKRLLIFCALTGAGGFACHAQSLEALLALQQSTTEGYPINGDGIDSIGQITLAEYQLHEAYFSRLNAVSPAVTGDAKLAALKDLLTQLVQQIHAALAYWKQQLND